LLIFREPGNEGGHERMRIKCLSSGLNAAVLGLFFVASLYSQNLPRGEGHGPVLQTPHPRYKLSTGDTIDISFRYAPEFNQTVTIQPDGYISLRDLPDMYVAGQTSPELAKSITKVYSTILHEPVVTVSIKDFEKPYFIAGGELGHPGKYDLRGDTTALQAIEMAGGFTNSSKHSQVLIFRRLSDQWTEVKKLDAKAMLHSGDLSEDLHLRPGDLIYVPKNAISKIKAFIPTANVSMYTPTL
jgi:polysaccharide biosynthesis/export protein